MWRWKYPQLRQGLVGAWCPSRDAARGTVRLTDQSPYRNHGTLTNMTADDWVLSPGAGGGYALDFDGSNDYVTMGKTRIGTTPASWGVWVYCRNTTPVGGFISEWGNNQYNGYIAVESGNWIARSGDGGTGYGTLLQSAATANVWTHLCVTRSASALTLYVNGVEKTSTPTTTYTGGGSQPLALGVVASTLYGNALIDDARVYNRALTPPEIAQLYRIGRGGAYALEYDSNIKAGGAAPAARNDNLLLLGVS